jgi:hypothetical protein
MRWSSVTSPTTGECPSPLWNGRGLFEGFAGFLCPNASRECPLLFRFKTHRTRRLQNE